MRKSTQERFETLEDNVVDLTKYINEGSGILKNTCTTCDTCGGIFLKEKMQAGKTEVRNKKVYVSKQWMPTEQEYMIKPYYCIHCQSKQEKKDSTIESISKLKTKK